MSTTHLGPEARYLSRFSKIRQQNGEAIKNIDSAGNLTEHITQAKASLRAQEANIRTLFSTAQEMIAGVDTVQQMLGHTFVKNMPLPTKEITQSPGKQLGYVQLTMRFMQAGVVHFMEQMSDATDRIDQLETLIERLAKYDVEVNLMGEIQALDLDSLDSAVGAPPASITAPLQKLPTPPASPVNSDTKVKDAKKNVPKKSK